MKFWQFLIELFDKENWTNARGDILGAIAGGIILSVLLYCTLVSIGVLK